MPTNERDERECKELGELENNNSFIYIQRKVMVTLYSETLK